MTEYRKGNAAVIVILLISIGTGAVATSPGTAQDVLPAQVLPVLPQFDSVETDASCTDIEDGADAVNNWVPEATFGGDELEPAAVKEKLCELTCDSADSTAGTYCADDQLTCVCRTTETS